MQAITNDRHATTMITRMVVVVVVEDAARSAAGNFKTVS